MKKYFLIFLAILFVFAGCDHTKKVEGVYRYLWGKKNGYNIWIIDGYVVRHRIFQEFLYGGNEQRYLFNPPGEIWIDHAVSCEEFEMTLAHELNERHLMAKFGWTYLDAHDSSLRIEVSMRRKFLEMARDHEASLPEVSVLDYENIKEIRDIPDSIQLKNIYRVPLGKRDGIDIWIVDGYKVRENIYPDFGFSGNDLAYHFIPPREIWIDGQVSAEETEYSIAAELVERKLISRGTDYDDAYEAGIARVLDMRNKMDSIVRLHPPLVVPDSLTRDQGEIDPNEK